ncbi:MAG: hypothetical protein ACO3JL_07255 [Myxococcota bacterium]
MTKQLAAWVIALAVVGGAPGRAARTLEEPPGIEPRLRKVPQRQRDTHLTAVGLAETCGRGVQNTRELVGLTCRLAILAAAERSRPLTTKGGVRERLEAARLGAKSARAIESYAPLHAPPSYTTHRWEAHRHACSLMIDFWDALRTARRSGLPAVRDAAERALQEVIVDEKHLPAAACTCASQTVGFAVEAGVTAETSAQLQSVLTSRGCFLDEEQVRSERPAPSGEPQPPLPPRASDDSPTEKLLTYARTREVSMARCLDKHLPRGILDDRDGLESCVCGELTRWSFPKERGRPDVSFQLPLIDERLAVTAQVEANGKVKSCGPLLGPMVR